METVPREVNEITWERLWSEVFGLALQESCTGGPEGRRNMSLQIRLMWQDGLWKYSFLVSHLFSPFLPFLADSLVLLFPASGILAGPKVK